MSTSSPRETANKCPACGKPLERQSVLCIACGYHMQEGRRLPVLGKSLSESGDDADLQADAEDRREMAIQEIWVPLGLLVVGIAALVVAGFKLYGATGAVALSIYLALHLLVQIPLAILGLYLVAALFGITFGLLRTAILKLAGFQAFALGASLLILAAAPGWFLLLMLLVATVSWPLFAYLFELTAGETLTCMIALAVFNVGVEMPLGFLIRWIV